MRSKLNFSSRQGFHQNDLSTFYLQRFYPTCNEISILVVSLPAVGDLITVHFQIAQFNVATLTLNEPLRVGDTLHILGHSTDFKQEVTSLQIDHPAVDEAKPGDDVGMIVIQKVHARDKVLKLMGE